MLMPMLTADGRVVEPVPTRRPMRPARRGLFAPPPRRIIVPSRHPRFRTRHAPSCPAHRRELLMMAAGDAALDDDGNEILVADGQTALDCTCCGGECGPCDYCTGSRPQFLNVMISGIYAGYCTADCPGNELVCPYAFFNGMNGSWILHCQGNLGFSPGCYWVGPFGLPIPTPHEGQACGASWGAISWSLEGGPCTCMNFYPDYSGFCGSPEISIHNRGGGVLEALGVLQRLGPFGFLQFVSFFVATATTTEENACSLAEPVTFTNTLTCANPSYFRGGEMVAAAA